MVDSQQEKVEQGGKITVPPEISGALGKWLRQETETYIKEVEVVLGSGSLNTETNPLLQEWINLLQKYTNDFKHFIDSLENSKQVLINPRRGGGKFEFSVEKTEKSLKPGTIMVDGDLARNIIYAFSDALGNSVAPLRGVEVIEKRTKHQEVKEAAAKIGKVASSIMEVAKPLQNADGFEIQTDVEEKVKLVIPSLSSSPFQKT